MNIRGMILSLAVGTVACAQGALSCDLGAAPPVPVIRGLSYDQARAALLAAGWSPGHGSQFSELSGNQSVFHDRGYTELRSCALNGKATCSFEFVGKGGVLLKVITTGEENPVLDTKAIVDGADLTCDD